MGRHTYAVYARFDNRPAGFCGRFRTRGEADAARVASQMATVVKRETLPATDYDEWARRGFRPRG